MNTALDILARAIFWSLVCVLAVGCITSLVVGAIRDPFSLLYKAVFLAVVWWAVSRMTRGEPTQ